jgi:hypothetical protein
VNAFIFFEGGGAASVVADNPSASSRRRVFILFTLASSEDLLEKISHGRLGFSSSASCGDRHPL